MKRCMLIVNPTAGKERASRYVGRLKTQLETMYEDVELRQTEKRGDATQWACEAAMDDYDCVFCMGGDGTLNETINGLAQAKRHIHFGFVPLGTVNDVARALQIPLHPEEAIAMLKTAKTANVDIGKANDRYFVNTIAAGNLPEAVGNVSIEQKTRLGSLAYMLTGMKALQFQKVYEFTIESDRGTAVYRSPLIAAMLTNSMGGFRNFAPQAKVNDGKLWLAIFNPFNILDLLKVIPEILAGAPISSDIMSLITIEHARITLAEGQHLNSNMDGDAGPAFPLNLTVIPSFLTVYVPNYADL